MAHFWHFNEMLSNQEKRGGRGRPGKQMLEFRNVLDDCEFSDLGYLGF